MLERERKPNDIWDYYGNPIIITEVHTDGRCIVRALNLEYYTVVASDLRPVTGDQFERASYWDPSKVEMGSTL